MKFLNIVSFIFSVAAFVVVLFRIEPYQFDYLMFLCTALGVIVTFLVANQFYSLFNFDKKLKAINLENKKLKTELYFDRFETFYHLAQVSYNDKNSFRYIYFALKAIGIQVESNNVTFCNTFIKAMLEISENGLILTRREQSELLQVFNENPKIRLLERAIQLENRILDAQIVEKSFYEHYL